MKHKILLVLIIVMLFAGCENLQQKQLNTSHGTQQVVDTSIHESSSERSLEEKFIPPNFLVREFMVYFHNNVLRLELSYIINDELYNILKNNVDYYFQVVLPENIQSIVGKEKTAAIKGAKIEEERLDYKVVIDLNPNHPIDNEQKKNIENNKNGYQLLVLDQDKDVIHFFDDIELFSTIDPIHSENTVIESE